jgi:hypothetical protein
MNYEEFRKRMGITYLEKPKRRGRRPGKEPDLSENTGGGSPNPDACKEPEREIGRAHV